MTKRLTPIFSLLIVALLLTACGGQTGVPTSWPGVSVDKDVAYVAYNKHVYAVDLSNGTEKWRFPQKADNAISFYAPPALTSDGQLIAGGYNNVLYSLNPQSGLENQTGWPFKGATNHYIAGPLALNDSIYIPAADSQLYALTLNGRLRWTYKTQEDSWAKPASDEKLIFHAVMDRYVYALDAASGREVWKSEQFGGSIVATPVLSKDGTRLYVGSYGSEMRALDARTGKTLWRTPVAGWVWASPALEGDVLYFGDMTGTLYALDTANGSVLWKVQPDTVEKRAIIGQSLVISDTVYFASESGTLFALDKANGNTRWKQLVGGRVYAAPLLAGDLILVAPIETDAVLVALQTNGTEKWKFIPAK